uniref:Uncharacterized protein n=1 Tax=Romanomermis culicivorax TaxID=13658 RepID=A0A915JXT4_ROMCU
MGKVGVKGECATDGRCCKKEGDNSVGVPDTFIGGSGLAMEFSVADVAVVGVGITSTGMGKTMVELCSAAILFKSCPEPGQP